MLYESEGGIVTRLIVIHEGERTHVYDGSHDNAQQDVDKINESAKQMTDLKPWAELIEVERPAFSMDVRGLTRALLAVGPVKVHFNQPRKSVNVHPANRQMERVFPSWNARSNEPSKGPRT